MPALSAGLSLCSPRKRGAPTLPQLLVEASILLAASHGNAASILKDGADFIVKNPLRIAVRGLYHSIIPQKKP